MLNIAYISTEFPPRMFGGLGAYTLDMTRMLKKMGHSVTVYTPNDNATLPFREVIEGINVVRPQSYSDSDVMGQFLSEETRNRWGKQGIEFLSDLLSYNHRSAEIILDEIKTGSDNPIDVCVAHDWLSLPALIMIKRHSDIATVYHVHSTEVGRSLGDVNWQILQLELEGVQAAHRVITVSNAMKDQLGDMGAPSNKISVCYNAVDHRAYD
ncbi:MAG: glycosyltransferase, partial [Methanosarcinales archaeon]|nr:glycosyltransferase [Methanosarcinales archaeon]